MASGICLTTERLLIRSPAEDDRERFTELFMDPDFMVHTSDPCTVASAADRFDRMLANTLVSQFSKRPIMELASDTIVGYIGVAPFDFDGERRLEFGYRLSAPARGRGYATEAGLGLLRRAGAMWSGTLMAMIDQTNEASMSVIHKLGFTFWQEAEIDGRIDNIYQLDLT